MEVTIGEHSWKEEPRIHSKGHQFSIDSACLSCNSAKLGCVRYIETRRHTDILCKTQKAAKFFEAEQWGNKTDI